MILLNELRLRVCLVKSQLSTQYFVIRMSMKGDDFVHCNNIKSLLKKMGVLNYSPNDWRFLLIVQNEV